MRTKTCDGCATARAELDRVRAAAAPHLGAAHWLSAEVAATALGLTPTECRRLCFPIEPKRRRWKVTDPELVSEVFDAAIAISATMAASRKLAEHHGGAVLFWLKRPRVELA
jgi:hypothetical protein